MDDTTEKPALPYRWVILAVLTLGMLLTNVLQFQLAGLASRLIPELHLSMSRFAMLLTAPMLTAAIFSIPAGAAADRFGVKKIITIGLVLSTIGSFARIGADNFWALFAWMFLIGFGMTFINANGPKIIGAWFPARQRSMAMGILVGGASAGIAVGQSTSALFPSIRSAFLAMAVCTLVSLVLWVVLAKSKPDWAPDPPSQPVLQYLGVAARSRTIWLGSVAVLFFFGSWVAQVGNLPNALIQARGISPVLAGFVASMLAWSFIAGSIFGPVLSAKIGLIRPFLAPLALLGAVCAYLSLAVPFGALTWIVLIANGLFLGAALPHIQSMPMLLPELGPEYAGSAGGILSTAMMIGGFFVPSYVITPLAGSHVSLMFWLIAAGYLVAAVWLLFLPEYGLKKRQLTE